MAITSAIGLVLEIIGVILMANAYISNMRFHQTIWILFKCFWHRSTINGVIAMKDLNDENTLWVLRGLTLIALGFVLQLYVVCSKLI